LSCESSFTDVVGLLVHQNCCKQTNNNNNNNKTHNKTNRGKGCLLSFAFKGQQDNFTPFRLSSDKQNSSYISYYLRSTTTFYVY